MLSDGVCACNGQVHTHTWGLWGPAGGGWVEEAGGVLLMQRTEIPIEFLMKSTACGQGRGDQIRTCR